jgi:hypothetical protein
MEETREDLEAEAENGGQESDAEVAEVEGRSGRKLIDERNVVVAKWKTKPNRIES